VYEMHKLQALHQRQKMVSPSTLAGMGSCVVMEWTEEGIGKLNESMSTFHLNVD